MTLTTPAVTAGHDTGTAGKGRPTAAASDSECYDRFVTDHCMYECRYYDVCDPFETGMNWREGLETLRKTDVTLKAGIQHWAAVRRALVTRQILTLRLMDTSAGSSHARRLLAEGG